MAIIGAFPVILQNGTTADATEVMADFNTIKTDVNNNAAANGANNDITSLAGLTTPLSVSQGGTGSNVGGIVAAANLHVAFGLGYLYGATLSNSVGDPTNDIDISIGYAADRITGEVMFFNGAALTNTTYHIFVIRRTDTGVVDIAADTSVTGANIPANTNVAYTQRRRIGSILRETGAIVLFSQNGDTFWRLTVALDASSANPGTAAVTQTLSVPIGVVIDAIINVDLQNIGAGGFPFGYLSPLVTTDSPPAEGVSQVGSSGNAAGHVFDSMAGLRVQTNTSAQIRSRISFSDADVFLFIGTAGWIDTRGRLGP